jgi:hypothetical protein
MTVILSIPVDLMLSSRSVEYVIGRRREAV